MIVFCTIMSPVFSMFYSGHLTKDEWMDGWMDRWMDGWMNELTAAK